MIPSSLLSRQYLGLVEVEESRGMHVCEDAVKKLKVVSVQHRGLGLVVTTDLLGLTADVHVGLVSV